MSQPPQVTQLGHFVLYLDTNHAVSAGHLGALMLAIDRLARSVDHFGPEARIEVHDAGTGTIWIDLAVNIAGSVIFEGMKRFCEAAAARMRRRSGNLADALARLMLDDGVKEAHIVLSDRTIVVQRHEVQAVPALEAKRAASLLPPPGAEVRSLSREAYRTTAGPGVVTLSRPASSRLAGHFIEIDGKVRFEIDGGQRIVVFPTNPPTMQVQIDRPYLLLGNFAGDNQGTVDGLPVFFATAIHRKAAP